MVWQHMFVISGHLHFNCVILSTCYKGTPSVTMTGMSLRTAKTKYPQTNMWIYSKWIIPHMPHPATAGTQTTSAPAPQPTILLLQFTLKNNGISIPSPLDWWHEKPPHFSLWITGLRLSSSDLVANTGWNGERKHKKIQHGWFQKEIIFMYISWIFMIICINNKLQPATFNGMF